MQSVKKQRDGNMEGSPCRIASISYIVSRPNVILGYRNNGASEQVLPPVHRQTLAAAKILACPHTAAQYISRVHMWRAQIITFPYAAVSISSFGGPSNRNPRLCSQDLFSNKKYSIAPETLAEFNLLQQQHV